MNDRDAFLQAIIAAPDDDLPRLVFADWLEEQGESVRAEFIRIQCKYAEIERASRQSGVPKADPDNLWGRMRRILAGHEREFLGSIHRYAKGWTFRRGFLEATSIGVNRLLAHADEIFGQAPIRELTVNGGSKMLPRLLALPYLSRLRVLNLKNNTIDDARAKFLAQSSNLDQLTRLNLCYPISPEGQGILRARFGTRVHIDLDDYWAATGCPAIPPP
jgi:uncharacterized protein (TIGR02996 family)